MKKEFSFGDCLVPETAGFLLYKEETAGHGIRVFGDTYATSFLCAQSYSAARETVTGSPVAERYYDKGTPVAAVLEREALIEEKFRELAELLKKN